MTNNNVRPASLEHWPKDIREQIKSVVNIIAIPYPSIGLDLDGVITDRPIFFSVLTKSWPGKVFVITYRDDKNKAIEVLAKHDIRYDELILVNSFDQKAEVIEANGIGTYFDDQPEMLKNVSSNCNVLLMRNDGNFDFEDKKWMLSDQTGKII